MQAPSFMLTKVSMGLREQLASHVCSHMRDCVLHAESYSHVSTSQWESVCVCVQSSSVFYRIIIKARYWIFLGWTMDEWCVLAECWMSVVRVSVGVGWVLDGSRTVVG